MERAQCRLLCRSAGGPRGVSAVSGQRPGRSRQAKRRRLSAGELPSPRKAPFIKAMFRPEQVRLCLRLSLCLESRGVRRELKTFSRGRRFAEACAWLLPRGGASPGVA